MCFESAEFCRNTQKKHTYNANVSIGSDTFPTSLRVRSFQGLTVLLNWWSLLISWSHFANEPGLPNIPQRAQHRRNARAASNGTTSSCRDHALAHQKATLPKVEPRIILLDRANGIALCRTKRSLSTHPCSSIETISTT